MKQIAETTGRPLARIAGVECSGWAPLESSLPATVEKLADRAFRASRGEASVVVYFEFYTTWDVPGSSIGDPERLDALFDLALGCASLDGFRAAPNAI